MLPCCYFYISSRCAVSAFVMQKSSVADLDQDENIFETRLYLPCHFFGPSHRIDWSGAQGL